MRDCTLIMMIIWMLFFDFDDGCLIMGDVRYDTRTTQQIRTSRAQHGASRYIQGTSHQQVDQD